jgi:hypothetical protein
MLGVFAAGVLDSEVSDNQIEEAKTGSTRKVIFIVDGNAADALVDAKTADAKAGSC